MADFSRHHRQLIHERNEIESRLSTTHRYGLDGAMTDVLSELSGYDQHPADIGSEMFEREKDLSLREHDLLRLKQVEQALSRLKKGTYGTCDACGRPIERMRLEAEPAAMLCITCEQKKDVSVQSWDRPAEEEFLHPSFGRSNMDDKEYNGFDGEDSWQAVAAFNNRRDPDSPIDDELYYEGGGYVEAVERISNEEYKAQLPD